MPVHYSTFKPSPTKKGDETNARESVMRAKQQTQSLALFCDCPASVIDTTVECSAERTFVSVARQIKMKVESRVIEAERTLAY